MKDSLSGGVVVLKLNSLAVSRVVLITEKMFFDD